MVLFSQLNYPENWLYEVSYVIMYKVVYVDSRAACMLVVPTQLCEIDHVGSGVHGLVANVMVVVGGRIGCLSPYLGFTLTK